jgi:1-acyl-sn-glycerol-3-phosphate acyltransferase
MSKKVREKKDRNRRVKMLFYIYVCISLCGSGVILWLQGAKNVPVGILLFILYFIGIYILCFLFHLLVFAIGGYTIHVDRLPKTIHTFYRWYGFETLKVFMKSLHIRIHIHGLENMPEKGTPFLLVGNHRSIFDPMIGMAYLVDWDLAYVSKQENLTIPFVGRYIAAVGCLPLDRDNPKNAVRTIKQAAENIRSGYANYGIYPEGGENKTNQPMLPFRNGAFKIAKDVGCQVILTTVRNSDHIFRRAFTFRPIHIEWDILGTIPAEEVKACKTNEISERAFQVMNAFLTENPDPIYH